MKQLREILEEIEMKSSVGISLRLGINGFDARVLPTSDESGPLSVSKVLRQREQKLTGDNLMLMGKLAYRRRSLGRSEMAEAAAEAAKKFETEQYEIKNQREQNIPSYACYEDITLQIKTDAVIDEPLVIMMNSSLTGLMHLNLSVKRGAEARIVILSQLDVRSAQCIRLAQERGSRIDLIWIPLQSVQQSYLALSAVLDHAAELNFYQPCFYDSLFANHKIDMSGNRARAEIHIPVIAGEGKKIHVESRISHMGDECFSRIRNRAVLKSESEAAFFGRQVILRNAKDSDSYQESRFLLMGENTRAHAHPVMVIDDNELIAGHAASVGTVDPDQLFYLQSRGLDTEEAKTLLTAAFLRRELDKIPVKKLSQYLNESLLEKVKLK